MTACQRFVVAELLEGKSQQVKDEKVYTFWKVDHEATHPVLGLRPGQPCTNEERRC